MMNPRVKKRKRAKEKIKKHKGNGQPKKEDLEKRIEAIEEFLNLEV